MAIEYVKNLPLGFNSYKICSRIKKDGEISSSVHELAIDEKLPSKKLDLKANVSDIETIYEFFDELRVKKSIQTLIKKYHGLNEENAFKNFIKEYIYVKEDYSNIPEITENDVNVLKEYLLKLIVRYFFVDFSKMKATKSQIKNINNMILRIIDNITMIIHDIESFTKNKNNSIILKFRLYRSTLYNIFSVIKKKSSDKYACLNILSNYKQKIMNLKKASKDSPFYKAIMFMKDITRNLNENSCLFDLLLQYNSGISNDIDLLRRKRKRYKDNDSKYELSMMTVKEVTEHLEEILPDFIIRYTSNDDIYAFYSSLNDIIFFNDKKTFQSNIIENYNGYEHYTLPIVILLIHECWGHRKVALSNITNKDSTIRNYLISEDFEEDENILSDKTGKVKGESGLEIEYLITGMKHDNIFSEYLLCNDAINNTNLLDINLWIQPNFKEFQNIMKKNCDEFYDSNIDELLKKNRENKTYKNQNRYFEGTYIVDDVEIGPLFKV